MLRSSESIVRNLVRAAVLGGSLLPAIFYLFIGYSAMQQLAEDDAKVQAHRANYTIAANPDVWMFATERMADQVAAFRHDETQTLVTDLQGKALFQLGPNCAVACVTGRAPLTDFGHPAGEVAVRADLSPVMVRSALGGGIGLVFGWLLMRLLSRHVLVPLERVKLANFELANYDPLTGLPNRRLLMDRLGQALVASERSGGVGALMFLDLDNFKVLNDTQGHDIGDRLLVEVGKRLVLRVRKVDTVSRLGGDEFVVVMQGLGQNPAAAAHQAEAIAEKLLGALAEPYAVARNNEAHHHSTASIGVTLFGGNSDSVDDLLRQADVALYQAKGAGRNAVRFFNPEMQAAIDSRSRMEAALRAGIERREFQLHYQPQVDQTGRIIGAEALLRWRPADQPPVLPAQFIALAEATDLIIPLGAWVMDAACAQLKSWQDQPATQRLVLAVNVSPKQFRQGNFVDQVRAAVRRHAIGPECLKLELTEGMLLDNIEATIHSMNALKEIGIQFSLDDFGTGYSSLQYLKRLPLDQIKIDRSFVRDLATDDSDRRLVRTIITMAHGLGMDVIAEGVETERQRELLLQKGCSRFQGYLFGRPVPIEQFDAVVRQGVMGMAAGHAPSVVAQP